MHKDSCLAFHMALWLNQIVHDLSKSLTTFAGVPVGFFNSQDGRDVLPMPRGRRPRPAYARPAYAPGEIHISCPDLRWGPISVIFGKTFLALSFHNFADGVRS